LTGVEIGDPSIGFATKAQKIWDVCNALGNIAFAYSFSMILIEIQVWCRILPKTTLVVLPDHIDIHFLGLHFYCEKITTDLFQVLSRTH
jgi:hypothetical protein